MQTVLDNSLVVLGTVTEGYVRFDSEFRFTFVNQAAQTLLGKSLAELLGKAVSEVCPVSTGRRLQESCRRAMAEHSAIGLEYYSEPRRRWYMITAIPDSTGSIVVQLSDITDRKLTEDALRKSEEKFSKVFQSNPAPMCIVDVDKNACFLEVNDAFERITCYRRDETIGRTSTDLGLYDDARALEESRRRLITEGGYRNLEVIVSGRAGALFSSASCCSL